MVQKTPALALALMLTLGSTPLAHADTNTQQPASLDQLQAQISALQQQVDALRQQQQETKQEQEETQSTLISLTKDDDEDGIKLGGAVRFQYSNNSYSKANKRGGGSIDFDTFRLNADGKIGDVILSAEWRWYDYMTTLHHAWVGYDFDPHNQLQVGLTRIPFGNQSFNSHSFFFSSNYYLGLEDNYAFGSAYLFDKNDWNAQIAFFKNAARGVGGNNENYSFDLAAVDQGAGINDKSANAGTSNTGALRLTHTFHPTDELAIEAGGSGLYGSLYDADGSNGKIGNYGAYALHTDINYQRWNVQLQATHYDYRFDNGQKTMVLGAYAADFTTPTDGHTYTANVAYHLPVRWGPITSLDIYNDYSLVSHKANDAASTYMNVTGTGITAGGVYAYIDYINARNQPFIGGDFAGQTNGEGVQHRFNFNIGYYF